MGKIRYLGSKARLVKEISAVVGKPGPEQNFVDLFCGTGIVSQTMGLRGWAVTANDLLNSATVITSARLMCEEEVPFKKLGGYEKVIEHLNKLQGQKGYFYREYSPSKANRLNLSRPYFTEENSEKIDAIRRQIKEWYTQSDISLKEKTLLLADLIESTNQIANIAGTYGCFLIKLSGSALKPLRVTKRKLHKHRIKWQALTKSAFDIKVKSCDIVYADPPYTKRQYAAYYHIPETLACGDEPEVEGITGLRPWKDKSSLFCYKLKATKAIRDLLCGLSCNRILISYSSDGHIPYDELIAVASEFGDLSISTFDNFSRYTPNEVSQKNSKNRKLIEYLFDIRK